MFCAIRKHCNTTTVKGKYVKLSQQHKKIQNTKSWWQSVKYTSTCAFQSKKKTLLLDFLAALNHRRRFAEKGRRFTHEPRVIHHTRRIWKKWAPRDDIWVRFDAGSLKLIDDRKLHPGAPKALCHFCSTVTSTVTFAPTCDYCHYCCFCCK